MGSSPTYGAPRLAVVAVAGQRPADGDDDNLVVGRVTVVLLLLGDGVIASVHQGAVHNEHGVLAELLALLQSQQGPSTRRPSGPDPPAAGFMADPCEPGLCPRVVTR
jgi:hypothetical protein